MPAHTDEQSTERLLARFGRTFEAGDIIFQQGSPAREAFLLQTGKVKLLHRVTMQHERTLRVAKPGDLFGEAALLDAATYPSTAIALGHCTALGLDAPTFEQIAVNGPSIAIQVVRQLVIRVAEVEEQLELYASKSEYAKVALALLRLGKRLGTDSEGPIAVTISPLELAARVGLDIGTVRRQVQQLRDSGYVRVIDETVQIVNFESLQELSRMLELADELHSGNVLSLRPQ